MTEALYDDEILQADKLKEMGMHNFDAWAANFGEAVTAIELAPKVQDTSKNKVFKVLQSPRTHNVFKECARYKDADMLISLF